MRLARLVVAALEAVVVLGRGGGGGGAAATAVAVVEVVARTHGAANVTDVRPTTVAGRRLR